MIFMSLFETVAHLFHPRKSNNQRPRIIHPEGYLLFFFILTSFSIAIHQLSPWIFSRRAGGILGYSSTITQQKVIDQTNALRRREGLTDLQFNEYLSQAALAKARDMFRDQYWSHYSPSGKSPWEFIKASNYTYSVAGENLARDFLQTEDMMTAWMNSPTHRENIVNPRYQDIGIAVVNGELNGVETTLVVQMFGTQLNPGGPIADVDDKAENIEVEQIPVPKVSIVADNTIITESRDLNAANGGVLALTIESLSLPKNSLLYSPLHVTKALSLAVIMIIVSVLTYDFVIVNNRKTVRFVGKNFAHIALFITISFLILFFKSGNVM